MKRLLAIAATGIYLGSVFPGTIWADTGGASGGASGGSHSTPGLSDTGGTGKNILPKDLGIKDDSLKSKAKDVRDSFKGDIPGPAEIFKD